MRSRQCDFTFPELFVFLKIADVYRLLRQKNPYVRVFLQVTSIFWYYLSQCVDSQSAERIFKLMQNHAHHKTTPNTVFERPSILIVSVTSDDFYRFNQTFWCSTVGVFLLETHKNTKFLELFSKRFCIESFFIFKTKSWYLWWTVLVFLNIVLF